MWIGEHYETTANPVEYLFEITIRISIRTSKIMYSIDIIDYSKSNPCFKSLNVYNFNIMFHSLNVQNVYVVFKFD